MLTPMASQIFMVLIIKINHIYYIYIGRVFLSIESHIYDTFKILAFSCLISLDLPWILLHI